MTNPLPEKLEIKLKDCIGGGEKVLTITNARSNNCIFFNDGEISIAYDEIKNVCKLLKLYQI